MFHHVLQFESYFRELHVVKYLYKTLTVASTVEKTCENTRIVHCVTFFSKFGMIDRSSHEMFENYRLQVGKPPWWPSVDGKFKTSSACSLLLVTEPSVCVLL